ncbi:hypothetical protein [Nostoc sp.]
MHRSPSGAEAKIKQLLMQPFAALGVEVWCVACCLFGISYTKYTWI